MCVMIMCFRYQIGYDSPGVVSCNRVTLPLCLLFVVVVAVVVDFSFL